MTRILILSTDSIFNSEDRKKKTKKFKNKYVFATNMSIKPLNLTQTFTFSTQIFYQI